MNLCECTYLLGGKSSGLGSSVSFGINPNVFGKDNITGEGKGVVSLNDGRVQGGLSGLLAQDTSLGEKGAVGDGLGLERLGRKGHGAGSTGQEGNRASKLHLGLQSG